MSIPVVPGSAGVINTGGAANTPDFSAFLQLAAAADQKKKAEADQKKKDAQQRASQMLQFAQQYGIFPEPSELQKAIKDGFGYSPMDPAVVGQAMGGAQALGVNPNAVTGTGKALQNPGMVPNVQPTTPAGSGVVEKGATGNLVPGMNVQSLQAPPLAPNIDRDAIMDYARQRFGLAANVAGAQIEAGQRQKWEDSYAQHVAQLHADALAGDPKAILNYNLIANNGKVDPKLLEALPFLTSPDKRQDVYEVLHDMEDAQNRDKGKNELQKTVIEHMSDRFDSPIDMQHFINDIADNKPTTGITMAPGKEKYKDTLDTLTTMIGDPTASGHIMDLWVNGVPLGKAIDVTLPANFLSLPQRKQLVDQANALSNQIRAKAEELNAATNAAKETREAQAQSDKQKLGPMNSALDILTSPNATKLDPEFSKGLEQMVAPYLGLQRGKKSTWTSPLNGVDTYTPARPDTSSFSGAPQGKQPGPIDTDKVGDSAAAFAELFGSAGDPAAMGKLLATPEGQSAMNGFMQLLQSIGGVGRGLMQPGQTGR